MWRRGRVRRRRDHDPSERHLDIFPLQERKVHQKNESPRWQSSRRMLAQRVKKHTGMPDEQDMPAPVTTTIFLLLTTEREMSERVRLV